eukprot:1296619-Amphidinium_carterae.2
MAKEGHVPGVTSKIMFCILFGLSQVLQTSRTLKRAGTVLGWSIIAVSLPALPALGLPCDDDPVVAQKRKGLT